MATAATNAWTMLQHPTVFAAAREQAVHSYHRSLVEPVTSVPQRSARELVKQLRELSTAWKNAVEQATPQAPVLTKAVTGVKVHYSKLPMESLSRTRLSQTPCNTVNIGRVLICRVVSVAIHTAVTQIIVEDEDKWAIPLTLWRVSASEADPSIGEYLPIGTLIAIREPHPRTSFAGRVVLAGAPIAIGISPSIHVDSPTDIVRLPPNSIELPTGSPTFTAHFPQTVEGKVAYLRKQANNAFGANRWRSARDMYTAALECSGVLDDATVSILYVNRAAAEIKLGNNHAALRDAECALANPNFQTFDSSFRQKALYRAAVAEYGLRRFTTAKMRLEAIVRQFPDFDEAQEGLNRATERLREKRTGDYPWVDLRKQAQESFHLDIADFIGPITFGVANGSPRGPGLIVTKDVAAGTILLVSKAAVLAFSEPGSRNTTIGFDLNSQAAVFDHTLSLTSAAIHRAADDPALGAVLAKLFAGPLYSNSPPSIHSFDLDQPPSGLQVSTSYVDPTRMETVCIQNSTPLQAFPWEAPAGQKRSCLGLFPLPSQINHSCYASAVRVAIGDVMLIIAARDLRAGEAVTTSYVSPFASLKDRRHRVQRYLFECNCPICLQDENDRMDESVQASHDSRIKELNHLFDTALSQELLDSTKAYTEMLERSIDPSRLLKPLLYRIYKLQINILLRKRTQLATVDQQRPWMADDALIALGCKALECLGGRLPMLKLESTYLCDHRVFTRLPILEDVEGIVDILLMFSGIFQAYSNTTMTQICLRVAIRLNNIAYGPSHFETGRALRRNFGFAWRIAGIR